MASLKEKIGYALGDAAAGGITWKVMSIAHQCLRIDCG